jgi:NAD(P)H dehydrogenase (quinone)
MTVVVTGATGGFGRHVVETLLARGVPAASIVATGRRVDTLSDLADRGVDVRRADFDDPDALPAAFEGAERLLLVSGSEVGRRVPQHTAAVETAVKAGARHLLYTSIPKAQTSSMQLAAEHAATERAVLESGVPHTFLRNGWYLENYTAQLPTWVATGTIAGAARDGRVSGAARADLAEAAAVALSTDGHEGAVYELGGEAFTLSDAARVATEVTGTPIVYADMPQADFAALLEQVGVPAPFAAVLADSDRGLAEGELYVEGGDLARLIGRPPVTLAEALRAVATA